MSVRKLAAVAAVAALTAVAAAPARRQAALRCGIERWNVKTLTDPAARSVNFVPRSTTVNALRRLRVPPVTFNTPRIGGIETTTYGVQARLVEMKLEADRDVHLVIASPSTGGTMIVEFPDPHCTVGAVHRYAMAQARTRLIATCGRPPVSEFRRLSGTATITGVGFVDVLHGQTGVAPNGIELHPVLGFRASGC
jgi:hypothetical protein